MPCGAGGGAGRDTGATDLDRGARIGTVGWILVVAAAWLVAATVVGVLIGRMIRERDRQVPPPVDPPDVPGERPVPGAADREHGPRR